MTLYYQLVFLLLCLEVLAFAFLILPIPSSWRRPMFRWISRSNLIAKAAFGLKVLFIFVFILFVDSLNRVYRVEQESHTKESALHDVRTEIHARKFYSQRNMYLTGFTLLLSLILNRTYVLILDLLSTEEQLDALKKQAANQSKEYHRVIDSGKQTTDQVATLKQELEDERKKTRDFETLKKQASQQHEEYMRLSEKYNQLENSVENRSGEDKKGV